MKWSEETIEAVKSSVDALKPLYGDLGSSVAYANVCLAAVAQSKEIRELVKALETITSTCEFQGFCEHEVEYAKKALLPFAEASDGK